MIFWTHIPASAALTDSEPVMWNKAWLNHLAQNYFTRKKNKTNQTNHNPDQCPHIIKNIVAISSVTELLEPLGSSVLKTASHAG